MTKEGLESYIKWIGAHATELVITNNAWTKKNLSQYKNCVCGVGNSADNGLHHWVYIDEEGYMLNYGNKIKMDETSDEAPYKNSKHNKLLHVLQLG